MNKVVVFAANRGYALLNSRRELIRHFLDADWQVVLATADDDDSRVLAKSGAVLEPVLFSRGGFSPMADWTAVRRMRQIMRTWAPALVHCFHAKPIMFGTWAARRELGCQTRVVSTITGLGHAFVKNGALARLAGVGYRATLPLANLVIFQNRDDRALFLSRKWLPAEKSKLIVGSGVPLERFPPVHRAGRDRKGLVVVMLGRLMKQKGIGEFAEISRRVRSKIPGVRFLLAGEADLFHPDAVDMTWLRNCSDIEYLGRLTDVWPLLAEADLFLFPSYYPEGLPRVVIEAAATGLPTVAFDVPGVRDAVHDCETGYLVQRHDLSLMTSRVIDLLTDQARRLEMGRNAGQWAIEFFDIRKIKDAYVDVYRELGVFI